VRGQLVEKPGVAAEMHQTHSVFAHRLREGRQHGEACGDQVVMVRRLFHSRFLSIGFTVSRTQQASAKSRTSDQVRL
jgi:hypothetical protein